MTSHRPGPPPRRKLLQLLDIVVDDLDHLCRAAQGAGTAGKKSDFSKRALSSLARLARTGRLQLQARREALGAAPASEAAISPDTTASNLNDFMVAYRRCGRHLCLAQREAREVADGQTSDVVFHLLRDLERQLWLLDGGRGGVPFETAAAPAALQYC